MCEVTQSVTKKRSNIDGECSRIATSTSGLTTEILLSEMDEMIGQGPSTSRFIVSFFEGASLGAELPPREEIVAHGSPPTRSKYYSSQSAKTLLKDSSS